MDGSVPVHSIAIQGYNWSSKNRNRSRFLVRDSLYFQIRTELNDPVIEILTIQINKQNV